MKQRRKFQSHLHSTGTGTMPLQEHFINLGSLLKILKRKKIKDKTLWLATNDVSPSQLKKKKKTQTNLIFFTRIASDSVTWCNQNMIRLTYITSITSIFILSFHSSVSDYLIVASFSHSSQNEEVVGGITKDNTCQFLLFLKLNKLKVNNHTEP